MSLPSKFVRLGKILQEWGIKGQVRFISFNPQSDLYPKLKTLLSEEPGNAAFQIESAKPHGKYWLLKLKGYERPEDSQKLRGKVLGLPREALPKARKGEIYLSDLEGLEVQSSEGEKVGVIDGFLRVGEGEVLQIKTETGGEAMVPYRGEFVEKTDLEKGLITLTPFAKDLL